MGSIALVEMARGGRDHRDPGHVPCLLVADHRMTRDPRSGRAPLVLAEEVPENVVAVAGRLTNTGTPTEPGDSAASSERRPRSCPTPQCPPSLGRYSIKELLLQAGPH